MVFRAQRSFFSDRAEAGRQLARALTAVPSDAVVLGIPRGGVIVAREVADARRAPLDVVLAHKLGAPQNPELAIGAVGPDGTAVLDDAVIGALGGVPASYLAAETERQAHEIRRRIDRYRAGRATLLVWGRNCILVDDGIATGSTVRAATMWLKRNGADSVVVAVPVAPPEAVVRLSEVADRVVAMLQPRSFVAVGQWYERFDEVTDDQVVDALAGARVP